MYYAVAEGLYAIFKGRANQSISGAFGEPQSQLPRRKQQGLSLTYGLPNGQSTQPRSCQQLPTVTNLCRLPGHDSRSRSTVESCTEHPHTASPRPPAGPCSTPIAATGETTRYGAGGALASKPARSRLPIQAVVSVPFVPTLPNLRALAPHRLQPLPSASVPRPLYTRSGSNYDGSVRKGPVSGRCPWHHLSRLPTPGSRRDHADPGRRHLPGGGSVQ